MKIVYAISLLFFGIFLFFSFSFSLYVAQSLESNIKIFANETAGPDTFVSSLSPGFSHGGEFYLRIGSEVGSSHARVYIRFNLSTIPNNATIENATLVVEALSSQGNRIVFAFDVNNTAFVDGFNENAVNWNNQPCGTADTTLSENCNSTPMDSTLVYDTDGFFNWTVTYGAQLAFNRSSKLFLILLDDFIAHSDRNQTVLDASDNKTATPPYLQITYSTPTPLTTTTTTTTTSTTTTSSSSSTTTTISTTTTTTLTTTTTTTETTSSTTTTTTQTTTTTITTSPPTTTTTTTSPIKIFKTPSLSSIGFMIMVIAIVLIPVIRWSIRTTSRTK